MLVCDILLLPYVSLLVGYVIIMNQKIEYIITTRNQICLSVAFEKYEHIYVYNRYFVEIFYYNLSDIIMFLK